MKRLKHLAVVHFLDSTRRSMSNPCFICGIVQADNIGVLTKTLQYFQIVLVDYHGFVGWVASHLAHGFERDSTLTVMNSGHGAAADLFKHLEVTAFISKTVASLLRQFSDLN